MRNIVLIMATLVLVSYTSFHLPTRHHHNSHDAGPDLLTADSSRQEIVHTPLKLNYDSLKLAIIGDRERFAQLLQVTSSEAAKIRCLDSAGQYLFHQLLNNLFPCWYGTEWDYNGITQNPGKGQIACGYFVSTTLQHCGISLNRYKVAQQYSHSIVNTLCDPSRIRIFRNNDLESMLSYIHKLPNDLYICGLDSHVIFIAKTSSGIFTIHSSYLNPVCVVREQAASSPALQVSQTYVLGHLSSNHILICSWLQHQQIHIVP